MKDRIALSFCVALSLLVTSLGTSPPAAALASDASAVSTLNTFLVNTSNPMVSGQTGSVSLISRQPIAGSVTFTEAFAPAPQGWAQPVPVYSCAPSKGPCSMTWSGPPGYAGTVTITAGWAGGGTSIAVPVTRSHYLYIGSWQNAQLSPLTQVVPAPTRLIGARLTGQILHFGTQDSTFSCLNGQAVNVFLAPSQFPDDYVAYHPAAAGCPAGAWLFPQQPAVASAPASASIGQRITLRGTFPQVRPIDAAVQFLGVQRRSAPILSWSTAAVDVLVPQNLLSGRYTLALSWHDPVTGSIASNVATPASLQVAGRVLAAIPAPAARVLDQTTLSKLVKLPSARLGKVAVLSFTDKTTFLQGLKVGDVIVASTSGGAPNGLLRKVTGITQQAQGLSLLTASATLKDVLKQGSYDVHEPVTTQTIRSFIPLRNGVSLAPAASVGGSVCANIDHVKLADDGSGDTIVANGQACLSAGIDVSGYLDWTGVGASLTLSAGDTVHVHLTGKGSYQFDKSVPLYTVPLTPIVFSIGPIPVVIVPEITFSVGANGKISASVDMGATQQANFVAGAGCEIGLSTGCDAYGDTSNSFIPDPVTFAGNGQAGGYANLSADVTGYASVKVEAMLYGVVGGGLELQGYAEGTVSTTADPWWTLYAGIKLNIDFDLELFGGYHKSWTLGDWKTVIAQASGPLAPPTLKLGVAPQTSPSHPAMCTVTRSPSGSTRVQCPAIALSATLTSALGPLQGKIDFSMVNDNDSMQATGSCTTDWSGTCQATWIPAPPTELTTYSITAKDASGVSSQTVELWVNTNAPPK